MNPQTIVMIAAFMSLGFALGMIFSSWMFANIGPCDDSIRLDFLQRAGLHLSSDGAYWSVVREVDGKAEVLSLAMSPRDAIDKVMAPQQEGATP